MAGQQRRRGDGGSLDVVGGEGEGSLGVDTRGGIGSEGEMRERATPRQVQQRRDESVEGGEEEIPQEQTPVDMIQTLRGRVRTLQTQLAVAQTQIAERDRRIAERDQQLQSMRAECDSLQREVVHQTSRAAYYMAAYSAVVSSERQVVPNSQYMARSEGAREPRQDDAPIQ